MEKGAFSHERWIRTAWERTLAAWPLVVTQACVYVTFFLAAFFGAIFLVLFVSRRAGGGAMGKEALDRIADPGFWRGIFSDPATLGACLLLGGLVIAWIFVISTFVTAGTYRRLWDQATQGVFTFAGFFRDGAEYFGRLLWYMTCLMGVWTVLLGALVAMGVVAALLAQGVGAAGTFFLVVIGFLALLLILPMIFGVAVYLAFVQAHLLRGNPLGASLRLGWETLKASRWRGLWSLGLVILVVSLASMMVGGVLSILEFIPIVKYLFMILRLIFNLAYSAFYPVFLGALSIAYIHETEMEPQVPE
jgi:hypothetical protein